MNCVRCGTSVDNQNETLTICWACYMGGDAEEITASKDARIAALEAELAAAREENERLRERRFPIQGGPSIPWRMIMPHEAQAKSNHDQTLERLAERGGLSPGEALAVLDNMSWTKSKWRGLEAQGELERRRVTFEDAALRARADDAGRVDDGAPRKALAWFARRMERKLKLNDHKDHWTTCEAEWLFDRMQDEREELLAAMPNEPWELSEDEKDKIIDEAADVANFAMMIADIARQAMPKARAVLAAADGKKE